MRSENFQRPSVILPARGSTDARCIHFFIGTDRQYLFTDGELAYYRYRRTPFWRATLSLRNANHLIPQRTFHIYRWWIHFSTGIDGEYLFTDGELAYHRYGRYRRTGFSRPTLCPRNANYFICQRTFHICRWWIHFSIGTDGEYLFTDGELAYHRYRRTGFWRATLCPGIANYLIPQRTLNICRWWIHISIGTDGEYLFTDGELTYHRYRRTEFWRATFCSRNANYLIPMQRKFNSNNFYLVLCMGALKTSNYVHC